MRDERDKEEREEIREEEGEKKNKKKRKKKHNKTERKTETDEAGDVMVDAKQEVVEDRNAAADSKTLQNPNKKRKRKDVFPFGNYRNYYGYRVGKGLDEDPRLKVLKEEWFQGKDCLDVGCNSGLITIQIAHKFGCRSILGLDIDSDRIADAYWHLKKFERDLNSRKAGSNVEVSKKGLSGSQNAPSPGGRKDIASCDLPSEERDLFRIVSFKRENFIQSWYSPEKHYDTILCLSVTKWIHLNWGDEGLISLFSKIWKLLKQGGILVLEPQPWKSYQSNRAVSETTALNFQNIMFGPESFQEILLDKVGFRYVEDVTSSLTGSRLGFDRPIFVFQK